VSAPKSKVEIVSPIEMAFRRGTFEYCRGRLEALKREWSALGFWARIWRANEFRTRLRRITTMAKAVDPRRCTVSTQGDQGWRNHMDALWSGRRHERRSSSE
jgi:hypothetical protein